MSGVKLQNIHQPLSLQEELKNLIKARREIVEKMSQLSKKRYFLEAEPKEKDNLPSGQIADQPGSRTKILMLESKQRISEVNTPKKQEKIRHLNSASQQQQSQSLKKIKEENNQRSKRLFQGLNNYLGKAKTKLQQQKNKRQQASKIIQKVQEKQKQKNHQLLQQELQKINTQFAHHQRLKNDNAKQILRIQNLILLKSYTSYANSLKPFAFTRTQPPISWKLAAKDVGLMAAKLFSQRESQIKEQNSRIIESITSFENKFDYSLYLFENENEYYQNLLVDYYRHTSNFLRTQVQPTLVWKPAQSSDKLQNAKKLSNHIVESTINANKKQCEAYYKRKISRLTESRQKGHHNQEGDSREQSPHKQE